MTTSLGALLTEIASKPDHGFRVGADSKIDRVEISEDDANLYNLLFSDVPEIKSELVPTEEEL